MHNQKLPIFIICISLSLVINTSLLHSLEVRTHELINERIALGNFNWFSLSTYLTEQLRFNGGINELFDKKTVYRWISNGGRYEDEPPWTIPYHRSVNHYHNPLTEKGFSGYIFGQFLSGNSLVEWAQKPLGKQSPGGHYSWYDVRDYFFKGLTLPNKTNREKYFAETFRGLGQLMHLVQDASVPAHTRDDFHLVGYEKWIANNVDINIINPTPFEMSILNRPTLGLPISNIFDTNQYDRTNPQIAVGNNVGLSEYTNANFFSEDTINSTKFPYPKIERNTPIVTIPYKGLSGIYDRQYFLKDRYGEINAGKGYLLSAVDYYDYWRNRPSVSINFPIFPVPVLDENVYGDYTKFLIPRAISYSAGLLKYFFRGELQVTPVPIFYKNTIYYLRVKIKNMTLTGETMKNGQFTLTYSYRPTGGNPDGSQDIWGQAPTVPSGTLQYGGDDQNPVEDTLIDFWLPTPIPRENYNSAKFTLAFKGTLGNEEGAVIGKALTLGEIKFEEEWNNGLTGNHTWAHTDFNLFDQNPDNGTTSNIIEGDTLVKDNIRYVGHRSARVNNSFISTRYNNGQFRDILPILITPDTYLEFKIDEMWINERTPAPPGYTNDWQYLMLSFNNGLGVQYFTQGQGLYLGPNVGTFEFDPNLIVADNIYQLFKIAKIPIPAGDMYLEGVSFVQQLSNLDDPSNVEHHQHMKIDSIRIIEGKQQ